MTQTRQSSMQFATNTPLTRDDVKKVHLIVQSLIDNGESQEFRQPVDYQALGLLDYPSIIKTPMDLGTLKKKVSANKYPFIEDFLDDSQLIWDNCKKYNAEGSWIHKIADQLEKYFRKLTQNYLPSIILPNPVNVSRQDAPVHHDRITSSSVAGDQIFEDDDENIGLGQNEQIQFSEKIKYLSQDQLGLVVHLIQNNCPSAFKEIDQDQAQIIVDNLDVDTFRQINSHIQDWSNTISESTSKKVRI